MWSNRAERQVELRTSDGRVADWLGLDEGGAGLLKLDEEACAVPVLMRLMYLSRPGLLATQLEHRPAEQS